MARPAPLAAPRVAPGWNRRQPVVERIPADRQIWFVSDLHLGDATPSDVWAAAMAYVLDQTEELLAAIHDIAEPYENAIAAEG